MAMLDDCVETTLYGKYWTTVRANLHYDEDLL